MPENLVEFFKSNDHVMNLIRQGLDKPAIMAMIHAKPEINKAIARKLMQELKKNA